MDNVDNNVTLPITINFYEDVKKVLISRLQKMGFSPISSDEFYKVALQYFNTLHKRIVPQSRKVLWSKELSSQVLLSEQLAAIQQIQQRSERGDDLAPFMSRLLYQPENALQFNEKLWNEWRVTHFHLSCLNPKTNFFEGNQLLVKRTGNQLYTFYTDDALYFLDVLNHDFVEPNLIDIIVRNWPDLLRPFQTSQVPAYVPPEQDEVSGKPMTYKQGYEKARNKGLSSCIYLPETEFSYLPPGGGITTSGLSIKVADWANGLLNDVTNYRNHYNSKAEEIQRFIHKKTNLLLSELELSFHYDEQKNSWLAYENTTCCILDPVKLSC